MIIHKVYLADIYDPGSPEWGHLTMHVVFGTMAHNEDIPEINISLRPYNIDDDDVHFYFTKDDLVKIHNHRIVDGNNYEITLIEEVKPYV